MWAATAAALTEYCSSRDREGTAGDGPKDEKWALLRG